MTKWRYVPSWCRNTFNTSISWGECRLTTWQLHRGYPRLHWPLPDNSNSWPSWCGSPAVDPRSVPCLASRTAHSLSKGALTNQTKAKAKTTTITNTITHVECYHNDAVEHIKIFKKCWDHSDRSSGNKGKSKRQRIWCVAEGRICTPQLFTWENSSPRHEYKSECTATNQ